MGRLAGVVLDEERNPVEGVRVAIRAPMQRRGIRRYRWSGETDSLGRFEASNLENGDYEVVASWPHSRTYRYETSPLSVHTGDLNIEVLIAHGSTITGCVIFDGEPLCRYLIGISDSNVIGLEPINIEAPDGRFRLPHMRSGTWNITLLGAGTRRKVIKVHTDNCSCFDLGDLVMEHGRRVQGHVRDQIGAAIADARVTIGRWGTRVQEGGLPALFQGHFETMTDQDGAFVFDGVDFPEVPNWIPRIWATHHTTGTSLISDLPPPSEDMQIRLMGAGKIKGIVHNLNGRRTSVSARHDDEPHGARMAIVGSDGEFVFDNIPPGRYELSVAIPPTEPVRIKVGANETASVSLVPVISTVELTVRIAAGLGSTVKLDPNPQTACHLIAEQEEDRCIFSFVTPGEYRISFGEDKVVDITVVGDALEKSIDLRNR